MGTRPTHTTMWPLAAFQQKFAALAATGAVDDALARWATRHPSLAEVPTMAALIAALRSDDRHDDHDRHDAILITLLRIASTPGPDGEGDGERDGELATHILINRFAGAVFQITGRMIHRTPAHESATNIQALVLSHLWERVRCYPLHRTRAVATNLIRDTQTAVEQELGVHCRQLLDRHGHPRPRPVVLTDDIMAEHHAAQDAGNRSASEELLDLLAWALEQQWLDEQTAGLLVARFFGPLQGRDGIATDRQISALAGTSHTTITRRRCRAEEQLAAAARSYTTIAELAS